MFYNSPIKTQRPLQCYLFLICSDKDQTACVVGIRRTCVLRFVWWRFVSSSSWGFSVQQQMSTVSPYPFIPVDSWELEFSQVTDEALENA